METLAIAALLRKNELLVSSLYKECARLFPQFSADFLQLAEEEKVHAAIFDKVIKQIEASPESWRVEKVTLQTIEILNRHLKQILEEVNSGSVAPRYTLTALQSFELSMTERRVSSMLVSQKEDNRGDISLIDEGFDKHIKQLQTLEARIFGTGSHEEHFKF